MIPVTLHAAAQAKMAGRIRGFDLCVYIFLLELLDAFEYRPLKQRSLQERCRVPERPPPNPRAVRRSVQRLETLGFLVRGPKRDRITTYRLSSPPSEPAKGTRVSPIRLPAI